MHPIALGRLSIGAALALFVLGFDAPPAAAEVIYVFGNTQRVDTPDPVSGYIDTPQVFSEGEVADVVDGWMNMGRPERIGDGVGDDLCDVGLVGEPVASDYVVQRPREMTTNEGVLLFSGRVAGIVHQDSCMQWTQDYFSNPAFLYPSGGGIGYQAGEGDVVETFESGRAVFHRMRTLSLSDTDNYRVLTIAPGPAEISDVSLQCPPFDWNVAPGDTYEYVVTLSHPAGLAFDADDPQIVLRAPPGATLTFSGGFDCVEHEEARIYVCMHQDEVQRPGEDAELTIYVTFGAAPSRGSRFQIFGSAHVRDPDLSNNECDLRNRAEGPGEDGGVDGGLEDGSLGDGGDREDTGPGSMDGSGPGADGGRSTVNFTGGGGCACDTSTRGDDDSPLDALAALFVGLALLRRRPSRSRRRR